MTTVEMRAAVGPFPLQAISGLQPEQLHVLEQLLCSLAADYLIQLERASRQDRLRPGFGRFAGVRDYIDWQRQHPRQADTVMTQWNEALGIRPTNNLKLWFNLDGGFAGAYDTAVTALPGGRYLRRLQLNDPAFYTRCVRSVRRADTAMAAERSSRDSGNATEIARRRLAARVTAWLANLYMSEAYRRLLAYPGASQPQIDRLCR